jgi:Leucine-rich repeat (LRR) protein
MPLVCADCEILNAWLPDHANSTGCCSENGITCNEEDRITQMCAFYSNISNFGGRSLTGPIPTSIGRFNALQRLFLNSNQLSGVITDSLCSLVDLKFLHLAGNKLSGIIPECVSNLNALVSLSLYSNQLSGLIPSLGNLINLQYLWLFNNQLSGEIPMSMGELPQLIYCNMKENPGLCRGDSLMIRWATEIPGTIHYPF